MTGIDRLRGLGNDYAEHSWSEAGKSRGRLMLDIADQIERERACDADTVENVRLIVGGVIDDMERHILGHEGMEDSPVARWARELRGALKSDASDGSEAQNPSCVDAAETADVTSEAQKVTREDVDAIAWVSDHGGLDAVRDKWDSRVDVDAVSRMVEAHKAKRERLKAHALGLERKCAERGETIRELSGKAAKQSDEIRVMRDVIAETCARFGVEGTGSTVDDAQVIWREISRRLMPEGIEWPRYESGEPVRIGDVVSDVEVRSVVFRDGGILLSDCTSVPGWGTWRSYKEPIKRPAVPASDGEPLEVGQTVWDTNGDELVVGAIEDGGHMVTCRYVDVGNGIPTHGMWSPSQLTHTKPEPPDSWERIEEDAKKEACAYFGVEGGGYGCSECPVKQWEESCDEVKSSNLVRRCRALAERERGE